MISFLFAGTLLGLSAGFSPGPLLALVLAETLRHDVRAGMKAAAAPLITDLPIVIVALLTVVSLSHHGLVLGCISLTGAVFVAYLGYESLSSKGVELAERGRQPRSMQKGILVNALSPHPYLFWFTVGAPMTLKAAKDGTASVALFIVSFYVFLVGSKVFVAVLAGKTAHFLTGKAYVYIMRVLGSLLILFSLLLLRDSLVFLGFVSGM